MTQELMMDDDGQDLIRSMVDAAEEVRDPLEGLVEATKRDPGTPLRPEVVQRLVEIKAEEPGRFEALRAELKSAGCRMGPLDRAIAKAAREKRDGADRDGDHGRQSGSKTDLLVRLADDAELFHTADGTPYADVMVAGHRETWPVRSLGFGRWLRRQFYKATSGAPNSEALNGALGVLEAKAHFDGPEREVFVRVAEDAGRIYLDLGNDAWQAVEIDANGWRVVDAPPVRFRRAGGMLALPRPEPGGSLGTLRRLVNVGSEADFALAVAWLLASLRPLGPYPVLAISGEQGSAKSTFSKMLKALVDPNVAPLRPLPRDERDLFIAAGNGHALVFDNLSALSSHVSDMLCRLSTGGGFATRRLHTDQEETLIDVMRPLILNGITDVIARPDLADRAVVLTLAPIPDEERRTEAEIWGEFEAECPRILGALLDALSEGLRRLPEVRLERLPRMADFARWAAACETALWPGGTFWAAYEGNRSEAVEEVIDADPVAAAVRAFMAERPGWTGTATDLLAELAQVVGERVAKAKTWPENARSLSGRLRRAATVLRRTGIEVDFGKGRGKSPARLVHLSTRPPLSQLGSDGGAPPSEPSEPSGPEAKRNSANGFEAPERRTVAPASDGRTVSAAPTVRPKPLVRQVADGADGADADLRSSMEAEAEEVPSPWETVL